MSSIVALLALAAASAIPQPPLSAVLEVERIPLPDGAAAAALERSPFERRVVLKVPAKSVRAVARQLAKASRLCPAVETGAGAVTLRCRTARLRADLDTTVRPPTLELKRLAVPPWRPVEDGMPLVPFDLVALGLGNCPGDGLEAEGECLLAKGEIEAARRRFEAAVAAGPAPLASLRLGDLALRADDPETAIAHWRRARGHAPYGRLAQARLCELDPACLRSPERAAVFEPSAVAWAVRADLVIRGIRLAVLEDRLPDVAPSLAIEERPGFACERAGDFCRRILLLGLRRGGSDGAAALSAWIEMPNRTEGPLAVELTRAAASQAEAAGAPRFAATVLASVTAAVPEAELGPHLLRIARLFLAAGERARADEIRRYARAHLGAGIERQPEWAAVERALRGGARPAAPVPAPPTASLDAELSAARAAVQASRLSRLTRGDRP